MVPIFDARAESLVQLWKSGLDANPKGKVNVHDDMSRLTFVRSPRNMSMLFLIFSWLLLQDVLCEAVFGVNLDSIGDRDSKYAHMFTGLLQGIGVRSNTSTRMNLAKLSPFSQFSLLNFLPLLRAIPTAAKRGRLASRRALETELLLPIIKSKRARLEAAREAHLKQRADGESAENETEEIGYYGDKLDLLDRLIVVTLESAQIGASLTDEQLMGHVMTFAFAGHETSSNGLAWTVLRLNSFLCSIETYDGFI